MREQTVLTERWGSGCGGGRSKGGVMWEACGSAHQSLITGYLVVKPKILWQILILMCVSCCGAAHPGGVEVTER